MCFLMKCIYIIALSIEDAHRHFKVTYVSNITCSNQIIPDTRALSRTLYRHNAIKYTEAKPCEYHKSYGSIINVLDTFPSGKVFLVPLFLCTDNNIMVLFPSTFLESH